MSDVKVIPECHRMSSVNGSQLEYVKRLMICTQMLLGFIVGIISGYICSLVSQNAKVSDVWLIFNI